MTDTSGTGGSVPAPKRRWVTYLLVASLGVNLLVAGMIGGAILRGGPAAHMRAPRDVGLLGLRPYYRALDEATRARLDGAIAHGMPDRRSGREAFARHLADMAAALAAVPYDEDALRAVLDAQRGRVGDNLGLGRDMLLDAVRGMDDETRAAFAARLASSRPGRP